MLVNIITLHLQLLHKCYMCWSTKFVIKVLKAGMLELVYINKLSLFVGPLQCSRPALLYKCYCSPL